MYIDSKTEEKIHNLAMLIRYKLVKHRGSITISYDGDILSGEVVYTYWEEWSKQVIILADITLKGKKGLVIGVCPYDMALIKIFGIKSKLPKNTGRTSVKIISWGK